MKAISGTRSEHYVLYIRFIQQLFTVILISRINMGRKPNSYNELIGESPAMRRYLGILPLEIDNAACTRYILML
jgi:hypothetical protein